MNRAFKAFRTLSSPSQKTIDWLLSHEVPNLALGNASPFGAVVMGIKGRCATDGYFEPCKTGDEHLAIPAFSETGHFWDLVCWHPEAGHVASLERRAVVLGAEQICNSGDVVFGRGLAIHSTILNWLRAERQGLFILRQDLAFDCLRDVATLIAEDVKHGRALKEMLKPPRIPQILVRAPSQVAA